MVLWCPLFEVSLNEGSIVYCKCTQYYLLQCIQSTKESTYTTNMLFMCSASNLSYQPEMHSR